MMTNNYASQSTEARNSAVVNFSSNSSYSNKIEIPVRGFSRDSIITWVGEAVEVERKDVRFCGWIEGGKSIEVHLTKDYFTKNYNVDYTIFDDGKVNMEKSGSIDLYFKVLKGTNINKAVWAITRALEELPYYFVTSIDSNEIEAIEEAEVSEAPVLDEAPCLEDDYTIEEVCDGFYEIVFNDDEEDDITDEGYFIKGLAYVRESLEDVDVVSMVKESMGDLFNDPYTMESIMRGGVFDQEKFTDALWDIVWEEHLCGLTDEALEAETRYYTDFDALCLQMCDFGDVVNRVVDVIEEYYNNYLPSYLDQFGECVITVYWNRFSEADMKMLIENEEVALAVRDVLLSDNVILDKDGFLVYDDGVYLTVDYNKIAKKVAA